MFQKTYALMSVLLFAITLICFQMNVSAQQASAFRLGQAIVSPQTVRLSGLAEVKITSSSSELNRLYPRYSPRGKAKDIIFNQNKNWFTGKVYDSASTWNHWVEIKRDVSWDAGHKPGHKFADAQKKAYKEGWTRKEWKKYQTNPRIYQPELPGSNRGHKYELTFLEKTQKNVLGAAGKTTKIIGKAVPVLGSAYVVYDTYSIESRYYRGEIDNFIRIGEHIASFVPSLESNVVIEKRYRNGDIDRDIRWGKHVTTFMLNHPTESINEQSPLIRYFDWYLDRKQTQRNTEQERLMIAARKQQEERARQEQECQEELRKVYNEERYKKTLTDLRAMVQQW